MKTLNVPQLIVSSFENTQTLEQNLAEFESLKGWLKVLDVPFKELVGRYKGVDERSVLISSEHRQLVDAIVRDWNQESYLELYYDGFAELVFNNGSRERIGYIKPVSADEASKLDAFTLDVESGQHYAVVKS